MLLTVGRVRRLPGRLDQMLAAGSNVAGAHRRP
jgi:hypothetical protein